MTGSAIAAFTPAQLSALQGQLRSALVADAMDSLGLRGQCLGPDISPLTNGRVSVGTAFPVQIEPVNVVPSVPYEGLLASLDAIAAGDIYVAATGGAPGVAIWGELVTAACLARRAVGAICDGYARDAALIRATDFSVFCRGTVPYDSNGRSEVVGHGRPVEIDGVTIRGGDLLVADDDGVAVVPREVASQVIAAAIDKAANESKFRQAVRGGVGAIHAFRQFGVL